MGTGPHADLLTQPRGGAPCLAAAVIIIARTALVIITLRAMAITTVKVNLERLRQHLIDMNDVTLRSEVKSAIVLGGSPWM